MKQVDKISVKELKEMAEKMYGNMVKADVDVAKGTLLVDMEMHADGEAYLLENGSQQKDLWGINLYPANYGTDEFIEYDSMINVRSNHGNPSRGVENPETQRKIEGVISEVVHE